MIPKSSPFVRDPPPVSISSRNKLRYGGNQPRRFAAKFPFIVLILRQIQVIRHV